jgi:hypothetical protein
MTIRIGMVSMWGRARENQEWSQDGAMQRPTVRYGLPRTSCLWLIRPKGRIEDVRNWFDTGMIEARRFVLSHGVMGIFFMPA